MNAQDFKLSDESERILNSILNLSAIYFEIIDRIGVIPITNKPIELHQELVLPYFSAINSKLLTLNRLMRGYSFVDVKPHLDQISFDWISCYDLMRSLYECFLQLNFVSNRYKTDDEKLFISRWFHVRFFKERALLAKLTDMNIIKNKKQYEEERIKIILLEDLILKDSQELKMREELEFKWKKDSLFNNWPKPDKLYLYAGVHENKHKIFYKMHSIYSHSEPLAIRQIRFRNTMTFKQINDLIITHGIQSYNIGLASLFALKNVFKEVKNSLENNEKLKKDCLFAIQYLESDTIKNNPI